MMIDNNKVLRAAPEIIIAEESENQWLVVKIDDTRLYRANKVAIQIIDHFKSAVPARDVIENLSICYSMEEEAVAELRMLIQQMLEFNILIEE